MFRRAGCFLLELGAHTGLKQTYTGTFFNQYLLITLFVTFQRFWAVLRIRMFLGFMDPDPLV
jgi:hypothetical protein